MGQGMLGGSKVGLTPQSQQSIMLELAADRHPGRAEMGQSPADRDGTAPGRALSPGRDMGQPSLGLGWREGGGHALLPSSALRRRRRRADFQARSVG